MTEPDKALCVALLFLFRVQNDRVGVLRVHLHRVRTRHRFVPVYYRPGSAAGHIPDRRVSWVHTVMKTSCLRVGYAAFTPKAAGRRARLHTKSAYSRGGAARLHTKSTYRRGGAVRRPAAFGVNAALV